MDFLPGLPAPERANGYSKQTDQTQSRHQPGSGSPAGRDRRVIYIGGNSQWRRGSKSRQACGCGGNRKSRHKGRVECVCRQRRRRWRRLCDRQQRVGRRDRHICSIYPGSTTRCIREFDLDPFSSRGSPNCRSRPAHRKRSDHGIIKRTRPGPHIDRLNIRDRNIRHACRNSRGYRWRRGHCTQLLRRNRVPGGPKKQYCCNTKKQEYPGSNFNQP